MCQTFYSINVKARAIRLSVFLVCSSEHNVSLAHVLEFSILHLFIIIRLCVEWSDCMIFVTADDPSLTLMSWSITIYLNKDRSEYFVHITRSSVQKIHIILLHLTRINFWRTVATPPPKKGWTSWLRSSAKSRAAVTYAMVSTCQSWAVLFLEVEYCDQFVCIRNVCWRASFKHFTLNFTNCTSDNHAGTWLA